ncbi:MAG: hypothetical protein J6B04_02920 [Clostridia bacterium]|nr:hypothetical protein [Clostridia bacterium]
MQLIENFKKVNEIIIYKNGLKTKLNKSDYNYSRILSEWISTIKTARIMPAFGVSLNKETQNAIKFGLWIEFIFDGIYYNDEMPYEKLLIEVKKEWTGFNLIRYNTNFGYEGRCFYLDLVNKNMAKIYNLIEIM